MKHLLLLTVSLLVVACATIDCPMNNTVYSHYVLKGDVDTLKDTLSIITLRPDSNDAVQLNRSVRTTSFSLPLSYSHESDELLFLYTDTLNQQVWDTVVVYKSNQPHFESVDCSPSFFHTIQRVSYTQHRIDSIIVNNPNVDYDQKDNFYIYFNSVR